MPPEESLLIARHSPAFGPATQWFRQRDDRGRAGFPGGDAVYDARIVAAALKGGATRILTLNVRDFSRLAPDGLAVVDPRR